MALHLVDAVVDMLLLYRFFLFFFFFSSRRRHTRFDCDWSSDVCSSDLATPAEPGSTNPILLRCVPRKQRRHSVLAAWSVDEAAKPDIHHQTNRQENKQRGGTSVTHQWQRNAGYRHSPDDHCHVYQYMEPKRRCHAHDQKHSRAIFRALSILH